MESMGGSVVAAWQESLILLIQEFWHENTREKAVKQIKTRKYYSLSE